MDAFKSVGSVLFLFASTAAPAADCDASLGDDAEEIARGFAVDCNENGVPDNCEVEPVPYRLLRSFPVEDNATGVHLGDLDGDGFNDLAIGTISGLSVRLRLPDEPGEAFAETKYTILGRGDSWVSGDLDGDGDDDFIASNGTELQLLYNTGEGTFTNRLLITLVRGLEEIAIGDVNGDGRNDIAVVNRVFNEIMVLENRGAQPFGEPVSIAVGASPTSLAIADIDADGDGDLVCNSRTSTSLFLVRHEQNLEFATTTRISTGGDNPIGITAADFNGDGLVDLTAASRKSAVIMVNRGRGLFFRGGFFRMEGVPSAVGAGDFDSDGDLDLVAGYQSPRGVFAFHNTGTGALGMRSEIDLALNLSPSHITMGDLDMDGNDDLVMILQAAVSVVWNDGNRDAGVQVPLETVGDFVAGGPPHGGDVADIDGDGDNDMIMGHNGNGVGGLCICKNDGEAAFGPPIVVFPPIRSWTLTAADLDGDGDSDVATSDRGQVVVLTNPGDGLLRRGDAFSARAGIHYLTNADIDADGDIDLVNATGGNSIRFYLNNGNAIFPDSTSVRVGSGARGVSPFDMDSDGDLDLAVASFTSSEVTFLEGDGSGNFTNPVAIPVLGQPQFVVTTDLDGDGRMDAASANSSNGNVSVFWSLGEGNFAPGVNLDVERQLYSMSSGDLTGDGLPELVTVSEAGRNVSVLVNGGDRTFSTPGRYEVGSGPRHVRVAEMDGDGKLDVVSINRGGSNFTVLRNVPTTNEAVAFLPNVCTPLDFLGISRASGDDALERRTKFLLPARNDDALLPPAFLNVSRFPLHEEFLAEVSPERFPEAPRGVQFDQLVGHRASRDYFAGTIQRQRGDTGFLYTFTLMADTSFDPGEVLTLEEVHAVWQRLSEVFTLTPLAYEPDTKLGRAEAKSWVNPLFPVFFREVGSDDEVDSPTFELKIPADTVVCGVFPKNTPGRPQREEYEAKTTLRLVEGTLQLPTADPTFSADLVTELLFGPERLVAQPNAAGLFRVIQFAAGEETIYRFTYQQDFTLPGGDVFTIQVFGLDYRGQAGVPVARSRKLDDAFLTFGGDMQGLLNGDPLVAYSSCTYPLLPAFEIDVTLGNDSHLRLREQFLEVESELDTGPAALIGAAVTLGGMMQSTDDYWRLVYAAERHNQDVRYWVLLEPSVPLPDLTAPVRAVEILTPQPDVRDRAIVNYLDADFAVLGTETALAFEKHPADAAPPSFRRGDVDGNQRVNIADAVVLLDYLFRRAQPPVCLNAGDANDDGRLNLLDAIRTLRLVTQGEPIAPPLECGADPTPNALPCDGKCP